MKKVFLIIVMAFICVQESFGGINRTLVAAQRMLAEATTIVQYDDAKKKFLSAKLDVGYVPEEHDKEIDAGIRKCNERIVQLSPSLSVDGNSSSASLTFSESGGYETLSISTNQGTPTVSSLPVWISVTETTPTAITIKCDVNNSTSLREGWFDVHAGSRTVRVYVSQVAGLEPKLEKIKVNIRAVLNDGRAVIVDDGTTLYASEVSSLSPMIKYGGFTTPQTGTVYGAIYDPTGTMWDIWEEGIVFYPRDNQVWSIGRANKRFYPGTWEYRMRIIGETLEWLAEGRVIMRAKEATYLKVNNMSSVSVYYDEDGGSKSFTVSTDGDDWSIHGIPSYCEVINKTENSFTLRCNSNATSSSRNDFLMVVSGGKEVKVNILQSYRDKRPETAPVVTAPTVVRNMVLGLSAGLGYEQLNIESTSYTLAVAVDAAFPLSRTFSLGGYVDIKSGDFYEEVSTGVLTAVGDYHNKKKTFIMGAGLGSITWCDSDYNGYNEWITDLCVNVRFGILFKRGLYLTGNISSSGDISAFSIGVGYNFGRFIKMKR